MGPLNLFTFLKVSGLAALVALALFTGRGDSAHFLPLWPEGYRTGLLSAVGVAMISMLFAYDGWHFVGFVAGEIRDLERNIPRSIVLGVLIVIAVYVSANLHTSMSSGRVGWPPPNGWLPANAIWTLAVWSAILTLTGGYEHLITMAMFAAWMLFAMAVGSVIVLRGRHPEWQRPYRVALYSWSALVFVAISIVFVITLVESARSSLLGLVLVLGELPIYLRWRRKDDLRRPALDD